MSNGLRFRMIELKGGKPGYLLTDKDYEQLRLDTEFSAYGLCKIGSYSFQAKCVISIRNPIPIRIRPPKTSTPLPISFPATNPSLVARIESMKVITPISRQATQMFTSNNEKLKPTASASMLVAILSVTRVHPRVGSDMIFSSVLSNHEATIRPPTIANKVNATQWSHFSMYSTTVEPKNHPNRGMTP